MADPRQIYSGLLSRGISPIGAVGLLANFQAESGLNPGINEINPVVEGSRGGFGLSQWTGPRRRQFEDFARQRGASLDDLDTQLDFTAWELRNTEKRAGEALRSAQTPEEAARIVSDKFLRPGIPHMDKRLAAAQQFSSLLGGNYSPPPVEQMQPVNGGSTMQQGLLEMIQKEDTRTLGEKLKASAKDGSLFDALALGFNTMRGPMADQGLAQSVGARIEGRQEQARQNQTAEWLNSIGRPDLAEALTSGMIDGETAFAAMQAKETEPVYQGGQWWDTSSGQPVALTEAAQEDPSLMNAGDGRLYNPATQEWIMAPDSGLPDAPQTVKTTREDGSEVVVQWDAQTGEWVPLQAPGGATSLGAPKDLTESQARMTLFKSMQDETQPILNQMETAYDPSNIRDAAARNTPLAGNFYQTPEGQQYQSASSAWAEGALRLATGAAATPEEFTRTISTYFAQPGDLPETIKFKAQMRDMYSRSIQRALGQNPEGSLSLPTPDEFAARFDAGGNASPSVGASGADGVTSIADDAGYEALPHGSLFKGPDGVTRRKP